MPLASLISGGLGLIGTSETNNTNYQIAKEANELKYKMFTEGNEFTNQQRIAQNEFTDQQRIAQNQQAEKMLGLEQQFALDQWQRNADYNSEQAQVQRMIEAGLNPALVFGNSSEVATGSSPSGSVPSVSGGSSPSSLGVPNIEAARMENPVAAAGNFANAISEAIGKGIDNTTKNLKNLAEIDKLNQEAKNQKEQANLKNLEGLAYEQAFGDIVASYQINNNAVLQKTRESIARITSLGAQEELFKSQKNLTDKEIQYFDTDRFYNYARTAQDILESGSRIGVNKAQAKQLLASKIFIDAQKAGLDTSNRIARETADYLIEKAGYDRDKARNNSGSDNPYLFHQRYPSTGSSIANGLYNAGWMLSPFASWASAIK